MCIDTRQAIVNPDEASKGKRLQRGSVFTKPFCARPPRYQSTSNRNAAPAAILATLRRSRKRTVRGGDARPVHDAITYLENHREFLGYPGARRRGLPIGSGNTEATCKTLFTMRLKRCGARWKEATAGEVVNLRALALSDRWNQALRLTLARSARPFVLRRDQDCSG